MKYLIVIFTLSLSIASYSQEMENIITDRPDDTESASLISRGYMQIESGFFHEEINESNNVEKVWGVNTTLLRYGLLDNLELRLGFEIINKKGISDGILFDTGSGFTPLLLGTKIGITEEKGALPQMALLGHLYLPFTAKEDYRPSSTGIDFRFAFGHHFTNSNLSYNLGAKWVEDASYATFIYSMAYGYDVSEKIGAFIEVYGDLPENNGSSHFWDGGLTYLVNNRFQLDAFIGTGFNNEQKINYGGGISFRIPN